MKDELACCQITISRIGNKRIKQTRNLIFSMLPKGTRSMKEFLQAHFYVMQFQSLTECDVNIISSLEGVKVDLIYKIVH